MNIERKKNVNPIDEVIVVTNPPVIYEEDCENCGEFDIVGTRAAIKRAEGSYDELSHKVPCSKNNSQAGIAICSGPGMS